MMSEKTISLWIVISVAVLISSSGAENIQVPSGPGLKVVAVTVSLTCADGYKQNSSFASDTIKATYQSDTGWVSDVTQFCVKTTTSAAGYSSWSYQHKSVILFGSTLVSIVMMMMMMT